MLISLVVADPTPFSIMTLHRQVFLPLVFDCYYDGSICFER